VRCPQCKSPFTAPAPTPPPLPAQPPRRPAGGRGAPPPPEDEERSPPRARRRPERRPAANPLLIAGLIGAGLLLAAAGGGLAVWLLLPRGPQVAAPDDQGERGPAGKERDPRDKPPDDLGPARAKSRKNLTKLAQAFQDYFEVYRRFPPAALVDQWNPPNVKRPPDPGAGPPPPRALLSWRVLILPYLGEERLYKEFKLDEAWDGPHNKKLLEMMPAVYAPARGKTPGPHMTYYQVFVGPDAPFQLTQLWPLRAPGSPPDLLFGGPSIAQVADGTSNTFLMVEAGEPVPWSKPEDLPYDAKKPLPKLGGLFPDGFHAAFFDAKVFFVPRKLDQETLRAMITSRSGEPVFRDKVLKEAAAEEKPPAPSKGALDRLRELGDPDPAKRREVVRALAKIVQEPRKGEELPEEVRTAYGALAAAVRDQDAGVAREAAGALGLVKPRGPADLPALLKALGDEERFNLFDSLSQSPHGLDRDVCPGLLRALRDDDYEVRARAAHALRLLQRGNGPQARKIAEALAAREARFAKAADELPEGILDLLEALHDKPYPRAPAGENRTPAEAAAHLARAGPLGRVAVPDLYRHDRRPAALISLAMAAGATSAPKGEGPGALAGLAQALEDPGAEKGKVLARFGPQAIPELIDLLRVPSGPRVEAMAVLGEFGPEARDAVPALLDLLRDRRTRPGAARALGQIGPAARKAVPELRRLLTVRGEPGGERKRIDPRANLLGAASWGTDLVAQTAGAQAFAPAGGPAGTLARGAPALSGVTSDAFARAHSHPLVADPSAGWRVEVANALLRIDPGARATALPVLKGALRNRTAGVEAALALARHNAADREVFAVLLTASTGGGIDRARLTRELGGLGPEARGKLVEAGRPLLRSGDAHRRWAAACLLAPFDPDGCLPVLTDVLKGGPKPEAFEAVPILGRLGPKAKAAFPRLRALLEQALKDDSFSSPNLRPLLHALARVDPDSAVPVLWKLWREPPRSSGGSPYVKLSQLSVQGNAFEELLGLAARLKEAVIPDLIADLKSRGEGMGWFPAPHERAGRLLAKMGPAALPALRKATRDSDGAVRARAAHALGRMGADAEPAVADLLKLTSDGKAEVRREALTALGRIAPRDRSVAAALAGARKDPDAGVRRAAARALGGSGPDAVHALAEALADSDEDVCVAATGSLARIGPKAVDALGSALKHRKAQVRRLAILALGELGPDVPGAVPALARAARDSDAQARRLAVALLDRPGKETRRALEALAKALSDPDAPVRWTAAFVLEGLGPVGEGTAGRVADALKVKDPDVRVRVCYALRAMGPGAREAVPAIKARLLAPGPSLRADDGESRAAVAALVRIAPDPVSLLAEVFKSDGVGQSAAGEALVQLGPRALPTLVRLARAGEVRVRAIDCLGQVRARPEETVPVLVRFLGEEHVMVRRSAALALGAIGPDAKSAVGPLTRMARDPTDPARPAAEEALKRIAGEEVVPGDGR
jgi:HEAT repeat protein